MPAVPARPTTIAPRPNDVTIARDGSDAFTVGTSAGPALTVCRTFDEAFQRAERFARDRAVSLWYTRDGQTWSSLPDATLLTRIRNEFAEMPGLRLTRDQARRLFALEPEACLRSCRSLPSC